MQFNSQELTDFNAGTDSWVFRAAKVVSALYLILFALFEVYSAAATALDHSGRFPAWETNLGWSLFLLPCELLAGLALLMYSSRPKLGFYLVLLNLSMYAGFMFLEFLLVSRFALRQTSYLDCDRNLGIALRNRDWRGTLVDGLPST